MIEIKPGGNKLIEEDASNFLRLRDKFAGYFFLCFNLMVFVVCRLGYLTLIILGLS